MITEKHRFTFPATYPLEKLGSLEKLLFFDIETTGFSGDYSRLYLIGCVCAAGEPKEAINVGATGCGSVPNIGILAAEHLPVTQDSWQMIQWFADTVEAEREILTAFLEWAKEFSVLVHFNGDRFDIPFLQKRCQHYGLEWDISEIESIDIYKRVRPYRKILGLDSLKQKSIEHFLGIFRQDIYSGGQLIEVYNDYLITHEDRLYDMLMLHNREDLEGMPLILPILCYPDFLEGDFTLADQQILTWTDIFGEQDRSLRLVVKSRETVPIPVEWQSAEGHAEVDIEIQGQMLALTVPLVQGTLKYFYSNYKDYYYLPYEDRAIHKSVGTYVERQARRQATAKTCYTWKSACFVPQPAELWTPFFQREYKDKQQYAEYLPDMFEDHEKLMKYLAWAMGREETGM